jgi:hypothetical protein
MMKSMKYKEPRSTLIFHEVGRSHVHTLFDRAGFINSNHSDPMPSGIVLHPMFDSS